MTALTLGGFRPGSNYAILPCREQTWWKPCLRRAEDSTDTHAWFLAPTTGGSLLCHACRARAPRVVIGPVDWIAEIGRALEAGDMRTVYRLVDGRATTLDDDGERGSGQPASHETQQGADTPGQRESVAAGNVADPHRAPVGHRSTGPSLSPFRDRVDWLEFFTERAAIFEYLGGHDRQAAERFAHELAGEAP